MNTYKNFLERGFIAQCSNSKELSNLFAQEKILGYIGFDPTANSLHIGSLIPILSLMHLQREGHRPIAVVGSGTALIGDPSGKNKIRNMLTIEQIQANTQAIKKQLECFLDFGPNKAIMLDNAEWLTSINYIDFLRNTGRFFSINRMLTNESVKLRLEQKQGLSFIEFNYILLQAYDFMYLAKKKNCRLQMGGNDQWGNIIAGINLTHQVLGIKVYGLTFPLMTTSTGIKMGKTTNGTIWLDPKRTSAYDFYQYWINTTDKDIFTFLKLFTFLPLKEIIELKQLHGARLREAKQKLAFEVTKIVHGENEARIAQITSQAAFSKTIYQDNSLNGISTTNIAKTHLEIGIPIFQLLVKIGLCKSSSEARRIIEQGGVYIDKKRLSNFNQLITSTMADENGTILLRLGKKKYHRIILG